VCRRGSDVVTEPIGLFVRIGMTADVDQQGGVINDRPLGFVEPDALGQAQRDHALPQHMLHRLPEAKVHADR
jgi:hypothetical protein